MSSKRALLFALLVAAAVGALYLPVRGFDYIHLDDVYYVRDNGLLADGLDLRSIRTAFSGSYEYFYIPLTWLSYMADVQLSGFSPGAFHSTNALLHACAAALLFLALYLATSSTALSLATALLWAIHPMRVESVAWITERKDVLAGFFFAATLLSYVLYARRKGFGFLALATFTGVLALLSKPVAVVLPATLFLMDFWPLQRLPEGGFKENRRKWLSLAAEKAPLAIFSLAVVYLTLAAHSQSVSRSAGGYGPLGIMANVGSSYFIYLWHT
ncbi:hypothetical protein FDZ71_03890, partial [bacterium]